MTWKESKNMPEKCNLQEKLDVPRGYYKVVFEKKGYLYVNMNNNIYIVKNIFPLDKIPDYVKLSKNKQGKWYVKK